MQGGPHFPFYVAERPKPSLAAMMQGLGYINDPDYLRTMHIPLLRGRYFDSHDVFTSTPVIAVDDTLVKMVFEGENPIGKHLVLAMPGFDQPREIIGIVNHVKHWGLDLDEHAPVQSQFYLPAGQLPPEVYSGAPQGLMMVMRSGLPPSALIPQVQNAVFQLDRNLPVYRATTMSDIVMASISARRFAALLLGLFAAVAFVLCAIGIYGVMAYSVAQRRYEFGVRTVLGAQTHDITRIVVGQGAKLCAAGIMIGLWRRLLSRASLPACFTVSVLPTHSLWRPLLRCSWSLLSLVRIFRPVLRCLLIHLLRSVVGGQKLNIRVIRIAVQIVLLNDFCRHRQRR
jgi:putative ABC transport system permease protein